MVLERGQCAGEIAERDALNVVGFKPDLFGRRHDRHLAERFRIADGEFLALEVLDRFDRRARHDDDDVVGERAGADIDDLEVLALVDGGDAAAGEVSPKPSELAITARTEEPPPSPEMTPVTSTPAFLKKPFSMATP